MSALSLDVMMEEAILVVSSPPWSLLVLPKGNSGVADWGSSAIDQPLKVLPPPKESGERRIENSAKHYGNFEGINLAGHAADHFVMGVMVG